MPIYNEKFILMLSPLTLLSLLALNAQAQETVPSSISSIKLLEKNANTWKASIGVENDKPLVNLQFQSNNANVRGRLSESFSYGSLTGKTNQYLLNDIQSVYLKGNIHAGVKKQEFSQGSSDNTSIYGGALAIGSQWSLDDYVLQTEIGHLYTKIEQAENDFSIYPEYSQRLSYLELASLMSTRFGPFMPAISVGRHTDSSDNNGNFASFDAELDISERNKLSVGYSFRNGAEASYLGAKVNCFTIEAGKRSGNGYGQVGVQFSSFNDLMQWQCNNPALNLALFSTMEVQAELTVQSVASNQAAQVKSKISSGGEAGVAPVGSNLSFDLVEGGGLHEAAGAVTVPGFANYEYFIRYTPGIGLLRLAEKTGNFFYEGPAESTSFTYYIVDTDTGIRSSDYKVELQRPLGKDDGEGKEEQI